MGLVPTFKCKIVEENRVSANIIPVNREGFIANDAAGTILMGIEKKGILSGNGTRPAHLVISNFPASLDFMALSIPQVTPFPPPPLHSDLSRFRIVCRVLAHTWNSGLICNR